MNRIEYKTTIHATKETVWEVLWGDQTYPIWTSVFSEGSKVETDWQEGSKILFLDAANRGMVSRIEKKIENEYMSFRHLGMINEKGVVDMESDAVEAWSGAEENYSLTENNGSTELLVEIDLDEEHRNFFDGVWPKAFEKIKKLAENNN